jgi:hypothetical protein
MKGGKYLEHLDSYQLIRKEDEGSMFLQTSCIYLQVHTALQPSKLSDERREIS